MQSRRKQLLCATSERDYKLQHWIETVALPRQNTILPLSGLLHRVRRFYDFCLNIGFSELKNGLNKNFRREYYFQSSQNMCDHILNCW